MRDAIDRRQSFNAIHFDSVFKIDIFIPKADEFSRKQLSARASKSRAGALSKMIYVATAEDTIWQNCVGYESGGPGST